MKLHLTYLLTVALAAAGLACDATPDNGESAESGESSSETGGSIVPCEGRDQASCSGLIDPEDEYGNSCIWTSLVPLTDPGNSCSMAAPVGRCMPIAPVNDGCGPPPELECTLGDTTEYGTGAVIEIDGQIYLYDGTFSCWPPSSMTTCEAPDTELGCECACDLILGG